MNSLYIFLLTIMTVGAVSIRKSDDTSNSDQMGKFRKSKLFYNFWIPLPGGPTQAPGNTTPSPVVGVICNPSTIITEPCSCGGHTCAAGRTCIDPGTTMTCTTPTVCMNMVISTALACTCGTGAAADVCTAGEYCNAAMNTCTPTPICVETGRYSMDMPCRCGTSNVPCGLTAPATMGQACITSTSTCTTPVTCTAVAPIVFPITVMATPCLCGFDTGVVVCPVNAVCDGVTLPAHNCRVPVPPTAAPTTG